MSKIKVVHVLHSVGGVDVSLRLILENVNPDNFKNVVIHGETDTDKAFFDKKNQKIDAYQTSIIRNIHPIKDLKAIYNAYRIIKKEKPDVIHCHSAKGGIIGRIVGFLLGIKALYTPQAFSYLSEEKGFKRTLFLKIEQLFANLNSILLASSNSEKDRGVNEVGYKKSKVVVFNNCINPILELNPLTVNKTWPDEYICTVGRPSYQKNIDFMIKVFNEVIKEKKLHLVIMGVGHHVGQLDLVENLIKELDLSQHVTLLKWTHREDVLKIVSDSKLYISTARYEGLPYSIIESLALSKPCVVSDCDGNRDLIIDGFNGYVIKNSNIELFKNKILKLINDDELREEFSKNALQSFNKQFNINTSIHQLESLYSFYSKK